MVHRPLIFSLSKTNRSNIFQLTVLSWAGLRGCFFSIWLVRFHLMLLLQLHHSVVQPSSAWHVLSVHEMCVCISIRMCIYFIGLYKAVLSGKNAVNILPWYLFRQQTSDLCCPFLRGESFADPSLLSPHLLTASYKAGVTEAGVLRGSVMSHNTGKDLEVAMNNEKTKQDESNSDNR